MNLKGDESSDDSSMMYLADLKVRSYNSLLLLTLKVGCKTLNFVPAGAVNVVVTAFSFEISVACEYSVLNSYPYDLPIECSVPTLAEPDTGPPSALTSTLTSIDASIAVAVELPVPLALSLPEVIPVLISSTMVKSIEPWELSA
jgi:hypothetical protein